MRDETILVTAAMLDCRLCLRCTSIRSDIVEERLISVMRRVQRSRTVVENVGDCDGCGRRTVVYRLR